MSSTRNDRETTVAPSSVRVAGLAVVATVLAVSLAEILLTVLAPQIHRLPDVWEHDPQLGWRHRPSATGRLKTPEFDVLYRFDVQGIRTDGDSPPQDTAPQHGSPGIGLYGDSFAEGWGVDQEQSVSGQLQALLKQDWPRARVDNMGVAGYGTDQQLLLYKRSAQLQAHDIVLVLFYGNDLWNNASRKGIGAQRGDKPFFRLDTDGRLRLHGVPVPRDPGWDRLPSFLDHSARHYHIFSLLEKALKKTEITVDRQDAFYAALYGERSSEIEAQWELTCRLLARFRDDVEADGRAFAVIHVPSIAQVDSVHWAKKRTRFGLTREYDLQKPNRILSEWALDEGVAYLDLQPAFLERQMAGETLYYEDSHWRAQGHRLAARETMEFLREVFLNAGPSNVKDRLHRDG